MNQSARKRRKLDDRAIASIWDGGDDDDFLRADSLSILSQYDHPKEKENQNDNSDEPRSNLKPENSAATSPSTSVIQSSSLLADEVIEETPTNPKKPFENNEQLNELIEKLEKSQNEIKKLIAQKNVAEAETRVIRDRYYELEKQVDRDKTKMNKLIESNERGLKASEEKYQRKIDKLRTNLEFKDLEYKQMREQLKRRKNEPPKIPQTTPVAVAVAVKREINAPVDRKNFEMTITQLIPHLTCSGDGVFSFSCEETCNSRADLEGSEDIDDEVIPSSANISPFAGISPETSVGNSSGGVAPLVDVQLTVIHTFLSRTDSGSANTDDGLDVLLGILEKQIRACAETWQTRLYAKPPAWRSSSAESMFSSVSSSGSSMTQSEFSLFERDELSILNFLWKIMKARPKLLEKATDPPRPESTPEGCAETLFCTTYQRNGDLVNCSRNGRTLGESLAKLLESRNSCREKLCEKKREDALVRILRLLCVVVGAGVPRGAVHDLVESGGVLPCLRVGARADVLNASVEFIDACVHHFGSLDWMCNYSKETCYVSSLSSLCQVPVTSSRGDRATLQLLAKIIDSLMAILNHSEGTDWLFREADGCNCSCEILNQLILALCTEATNCNADIDVDGDGFRSRVLANGIQFLHWLSLADPHFHARRHTTALEYNLLLRRMTSLYLGDGRTMTVVEMQQLQDLDDTNTILDA